jgi:glycerol-3-phosphate dehydrogenase (NAD(P)+)
MNKKINKLSILGDGAWGTALSYIASNNVSEVVIYTRESEVMESINKYHINRCFPDNTLPINIKSSTTLVDIGNSDGLVLAVPAQQVRVCLNDIASALPSCVLPILICSKGIENHSNKLMGDIVNEILPGSPVAVLSGANFASEVINDKPAAATIASVDSPALSIFTEGFTAKNFSIEQSTDIKGVQFCGAIKNVYAVVCGIGYGLELGDNFHAAILKKILCEMIALLSLKQIKPETIYSYAGIADLILTCSSITSRNAQLGIIVAQDHNIKNFLSKTTAEGYYTAESIHEIFKNETLYKASILEFSYQVMRGKIKPETIIDLI